MSLLSHRRKEQKLRFETLLHVNKYEVEGHHLCAQPVKQLLCWRTGIRPVKSSHPPSLKIITELSCNCTDWLSQNRSCVEVFWRTVRTAALASVTSSRKKRSWSAKPSQGWQHKTAFTFRRACVCDGLSISPRGYQTVGPTGLIKCLQPHYWLPEKRKSADADE